MSRKIGFVVINTAFLFFLVMGFFGTFRWVLTVNEPPKESIEKAWGLIIEKNEYLYRVRLERARILFPRKYDTIATWRLDTESEIYPVAQEHYVALDAIVDEVKLTLDERGDWRVLLDEEAQALLFFKTVHDVLRNRNLRAHAGGQQLLSMGLDTRWLDCDTLSTIYVAVGEVIGVPVVAVLYRGLGEYPGHMHVLWQGQSGHPQDRWGWEATIGISTESQEWRGWLMSQPLGKPIILTIRDLPRILINDELGGFLRSERCKQYVNRDNVVRMVESVVFITDPGYPRERPPTK